MVRQSDPKNARLISVAAATAIALACGTNYAYSAWAPQFAQKLKLNSTQSNLIGTTGNLGMYVSGVPFGMMVDRKGPRWGVAIGAILLGGGYYAIAQAYANDPGTFSVSVLCLFSFLTGAGSASAFSGSIKTAALNYPDSRGTATAFPLAAFGLSAFFFSTIASLVAPDDTYKFLMLLATGTFILPVISFFFLRVLPPPKYEHVPQHERQPLHRTSTSERGNPRASDEPGAPTDVSHSPTTGGVPKDYPPSRGSDESSSLLSTPSDVGDLESSKHTLPNPLDEPHHVDIRGFALLPLAEFWQLFLMLGLLTGIGLMTINNIGNDAQALWYHFDPNIPGSYISKRQGMHVSVLSFCSFVGRLTSGIGSDLLVRHLNRSRFWCLLFSAFAFLVAQYLATQISNPHYLFALSATTGVAYGVLFGVYPTLVAHAFGVHGLSQNWGTMTLAPVLSGNIFNILYGRIYDSNSVLDEHGDFYCAKGVDCYKAAYWVTFAAAVGGAAVCAWSIHHENRVHLKKGAEAGKRGLDHERQA